MWKPGPHLSSNRVPSRWGGVGGGREGRCNPPSPPPITSPFFYYSPQELANWTVLQSKQGALLDTAKQLCWWGYLLLYIRVKANRTPAAWITYLIAYWFWLPTELRNKLSAFMGSPAKISYFLLPSPCVFIITTLLSPPPLTEEADCIVLATSKDSHSCILHLEYRE